MARTKLGFKVWPCAALFVVGCLPQETPRARAPGSGGMNPPSGPGAERLGPPLPRPASLPPEIRAVWLTHYEYMKGDEGAWAAIADDLVHNHVNTVYLAMYADARPLWDSPTFRAAVPGGAGEDWARRLVPVFRSRGLRVGAWFEYGLAVGGEGSPFVKLHPDWLQRDLNGAFVGQENGMVFLSPGVEGATSFVVSLVKELAQKYEWDEVQLDRFRYTRATNSGREFGYERPALDAYLASLGQKGAAPAKDEPGWVRHREMLVDRLVERAFRSIREVKPNLVISSAPVGHYGIQQHMQRWGDWLCGGYLDLVIPQIYEKSLEGFKSHFKMLADIAAGCNRLDRFAVGLDAADANDAELVEEQLRHAQGQGVRHAALWVYHSYGSGVAVRDNLERMRQAGHAWESSASAR